MDFLFTAKQSEAMADSMARTASYETAMDKIEEAGKASYKCQVAIWVKSYDRTKDLPSPLVLSHSDEEYEDLRHNDEPSFRIIRWIEDEIKCWSTLSEATRNNINWMATPRSQHQVALDVALRAEKDRLIKAVGGLS